MTYSPSYYRTNLHLLTLRDATSEFTTSIRLPSESRQTANSPRYSYHRLGTWLCPIATSVETIQKGIAAVVAQAPTLNPKAARFFKLALFEEDNLKRFLYFFLAIEVKTPCYLWNDRPCKTISFWSPPHLP